MSVEISTSLEHSRVGSCYISTMSAPRPAVPDPLVRSLMIEAGYRCAVCRMTDALDIEHIEEWSEVRSHTFENMIVLCANCHRRKANTSDPRHINRARLKRIKKNLMMLSGRYSDMERRFIEECQKALEANPSANVSLSVHNTMWLQIKYLIDDGLLQAQRVSGGFYSTDSEGNAISNDEVKIVLSPAGRNFVLDLNKLA